MYIHLLIKTKVKTWTKVVHKNVSQGFKMLKFLKSFFLLFLYEFFFYLYNNSNQINFINEWARKNLAKIT